MWNVYEIQMYNYKNVQNGKTLKWEVRPVWVNSEWTKAMQVMMILIVIVTVTYHGQNKYQQSRENLIFWFFHPKKPFHAQNSFFPGCIWQFVLKQIFLTNVTKVREDWGWMSHVITILKMLGTTKALSLSRYCHTPLFDIHCMYWQYETHFFYISIIGMPSFILL